MSENLGLWNKIEKTDPNHVKAITGKSYQGTSPKPHYLVHKATETFGPVGIGWGFTIVSERIEEGAGGEKMHIAHVRVWYMWDSKRGEVEHIGGTQFSGIRSSGKAFTDEDAPKKSVTDALVKALSMIGFAGDIFMGRYDDSKYVNELRQEHQAPEARPRVSGETPTTQKDMDTPQRLTPEQSKALLGRLLDAFNKLHPVSVDEWWGNDKVSEARNSLLPGHYAEMAVARTRGPQPPTAAVPANFDKIANGQDGYEQGETK